MVRKSRKERSRRIFESLPYDDKTSQEHPESNMLTCSSNVLQVYCTYCGQSFTRDEVNKLIDITR